MARPPATLDSARPADLLAQALLAAQMAETFYLKVETLFWQNGIVTIVPPSGSAGSSSGHVAFYVETKGKNVVLLGGNQSRRGKLSELTHVLGYRWPTKFD